MKRTSRRQQVERVTRQNWWRRAREISAEAIGVSAQGNENFEPRAVISDEIVKRQFMPAVEVFQR